MMIGWNIIKCISDTFLILNLMLKLKKWKTDQNFNEFYKIAWTEQNLNR